MLNSPNIGTNSTDPGTYTSLNDASGVREKTILGNDLILPTTELGAAISHNLVFIDGAIANNSNLAQSFSNAQVFTLDPHLDGVAQISDILAHYQNVASVHIVSHGNVADVALGNTHLNLQNLSLYSSNLQSWSHAFTQNTDVLFYGCNVGADAEGELFIQQLSQLTGADIAASNNLTGSSQFGGDWNLEVATGSIESIDVLDKSAIANYNGANLAGIDDGLIARWQLDEGSGLTATDTIQNNNGTLLNNPQWSTTGKVNGSLRFDGIDDYVNVPSNPGLNLSAGIFTQSAWIYSNITDNAYHGILGYQPVAGNNQRYPGIWVYNQTQIHAGFGDGSNWNAFTTGNVLKTNAWNHVATTFDGTTYKAYVNGQEVFSTNSFAGRKPYATQQLNIGRVDNNFAGQIDDVRIYNRALTAADIATLAQLGTPNPGTISLENNAIAVNETDGSATIAVIRQQGSDGTVTVNYRTVNGSATAGADYTGQSGTLTFAPGETRKSVAIPILDDNLAEPNETFGFTIDSITGGATLSAPQSAEITIVDNENSTGLVGYWKLDETSIGATVVDSSGFNNNGNHVNITSPSGPSTNVPLLTFADPNSLRFDGVDDYVNVPNNPSLNLNNGKFTQAVWIYSNITDNGYHGILGYQSAAGTSQRYPGIWVYNQTQIHAGFGDGSNWNSFTTGNVLKPNSWNHVATSFDGTTYKAYVNGQEVYSTNDFAGRKPYATQQLNIGRVDNNFVGQIDDVRIYNRALTAADIATLAQIQTPPPTSSPGVIGLETSTITVNEANGTATVTVLRQQGSDGTVTVDYQTVDGSATPGADYIRQSGTLTFAPGETRKSVTIPILDDTLSEGNETFGFAIDNITGGASLLAPRTAQITIVDDENVSGLVGYWKLDESSTGVTVIDSSGFNNNGNHVNIALPSGPTTKVPLLNFVDTHSLTFDGIDDYVNVPSSPTLNLSNGTFTQSVWIYSNTVNNGYQGILGYQPASGNNAQRYPGIWLYNQTQIHAGFGDGTNWNGFTTGNVLRLNAWNQVVTSFDGTTYKAYVNGQEVYSTTQFAGRKPYATQQLNIGRIDNNFSGQIDDVRIYNTALTATEIQQLYQAQPLPDQRQLFTDTVISGLVQPTAIDWTPAGQLPDGQLMFVAEKSGVVKVFKNGSLLPTPFIDISRQVNNVSDRGLIDIAVHPDFVNNPYVYLAFTYDPPEVYQNTGLAGPDQEGNRAGRLIRVTADASKGYTTAIPGSEVVLLGKNSTWNNFNGFVNSTVDFNEPPAGILPNGQNLQDFLAGDSTTHSVGTVRFGPDGALYISNGDATSYNQVDPRTYRVQDIDNLSGKILRIDPITGQGLQDNPFYNGDPNSNRSKVYQYGLRNAFRFTIDPQTGKVYIGEVGWTQWEEINAGGAGTNYGWPYYEGGSGVNLPTSGYKDLPQSQAFYASGQTTTPAIYALNHSTSGINAIVMGDLYTGTAYPEQYWGDLFFNDLGQGIVRNLSFDSAGNITSVETFATGAQIVVQINMGPDGNLYFVDLNDGLVGRWRFA
ncbi:LamG-like jellyroll fold domain-containing protein [Calothrix sp. NIES-2098]|uniref:LamG-like jellyroll fold domain-containing protein n=1 Tax=Calothrix sp. NIES-2098 TaxID=1954171 RepID=UPI000B5F22A4|nr:PA14 domain-containing protein [Calothrix sp. NIES-2098]